MKKPNSEIKIEGQDIPKNESKKKERINSLNAEFEELREKIRQVEQNNLRMRERIDHESPRKHTTSKVNLPRPSINKLSLQRIPTKMTNNDKQFIERSRTPLQKKRSDFELTRNNAISKKSIAAPEIHYSNKYNTNINIKKQEVLKSLYLESSKEKVQNNHQKHKNLASYREQQIKVPVIPLPKSIQKRIAKRIQKKYQQQANNSSSSQQISPRLVSTANDQNGFLMKNFNKGTFSNISYEKNELQLQSGDTNSRITLDITFLKQSYSIMFQTFKSHIFSALQKITNKIKIIQQKHINLDLSLQQLRQSCHTVDIKNAFLRQHKFLLSQAQTKNKSLQKNIFDLHAQIQSLQNMHLLNKSSSRFSIEMKQSPQKLVLQNQDLLLQISKLQKQYQSKLQKTQLKYKKIQKQLQEKNNQTQDMLKLKQQELMKKQIQVLTLNSSISKLTHQIQLNQRKNSQINGRYQQSKYHYQTIKQQYQDHQKKTVKKEIEQAESISKINKNLKKKGKQLDDFKNLIIKCFQEIQKKIPVRIKKQHQQLKHHKNRTDLCQVFFKQINCFIEEASLQNRNIKTSLKEYFYIAEAEIDRDGIISVIKTLYQERQKQKQNFVKCEQQQSKQLMQLKNELTHLRLQKISNSTSDLFQDKLIQSEGKVMELEFRNQQLKLKIASLESHERQLDKQIQQFKLIKKKSHNQQKVQSLTKKLQKKIQNLTRTLAIKQQTINTLLQQKVALNIEIKILSQRCESLIQPISIQNIPKINFLEHKEIQCTLENYHLKEVEKQLKTKTKIILQLELNQTELSKTITQLENQNKKLQNKYQQQCQNFKQIILLKDQSLKNQQKTTLLQEQFKKQLKKKSQELQKYTKQKQNLLNQIKQHHEKMKQLNRQNQELKKMLNKKEEDEQLRSSIDKQSAEIKFFEKEKKYKQQIFALQECAAKKESEVMQLIKKCQCLKLQLQDEKNQKSDILKAERFNSTKDIQLFKEQWQFKFQTSQKNLKEKQQEIVKLKTNLQTVQVCALKYKNQIEQIKVAYDKSFLQLMNCNQQLKIKMNKQNDQWSIFHKDKLADKQKKINLLEEKTFALQQHIMSQKQQMINLQDANQKLNKQLLLLNKEKVELQIKILSLYEKIEEKLTNDNLSSIYQQKIIQIKQQLINKIKTNQQKYNALQQIFQRDTQNYKQQIKQKDFLIMKTNQQMTEINLNLNQQIKLKTLSLKMFQDLQQKNKKQEEEKKLLFLEFQTKKNENDNNFDVVCKKMNFLEQQLKNKEINLQKYQKYEKQFQSQRKRLQMQIQQQKAIINKSKQQIILLKTQQKTIINKANISQIKKEELFAKIQKEKNQLQTQISILKQQLEEQFLKAQQHQDLKNNYTTLLNKNNQFEKTLIHKQNQIFQLIKKNQQLSFELNDDIDAKSQYYRGIVQQKLSQTQLLKENIEAAERQIQLLKEQINDIEIQKEKIKSQCKAFHAENLELKKINLIHQQKVKQMLSKDSKKNQQMQTLCQKLNIKTTQIAQMNKMIKQKDIILDKLNLFVIELQTKITSNINEKNQSQKDKKEKQSLLQNNKNKVLSLQILIKKLQTQNQLQILKSKKENQQHCKNIDKIQKSLKQKQKQVNLLQEKFNQQMQNLSQQLKHKNLLNKKIEEQLNMIERQLSLSKKQLLQKQQQIKQLQQNLMLKQKQILFINEELNNSQLLCNEQTSKMQINEKYLQKISIQLKKQKEHQCDLQKGLTLNQNQTLKLKNQIRKQKQNRQQLEQKLVLKQRQINLISIKLTEQISYQNQLKQIQKKQQKQISSSQQEIKQLYLIQQRLKQQNTERLKQIIAISDRLEEKEKTIVCLKDQMQKQKINNNKFIIDQKQNDIINNKQIETLQKTNMDLHSKYNELQQNYKHQLISQQKLNQKQNQKITELNILKISLEQQYKKIKIQKNQIQEKKYELQGQNIKINKSFQNKIIFLKNKIIQDEKKTAQLQILNLQNKKLNDKLMKKQDQIFQLIKKNETLSFQLNDEIDAKSQHYKGIVEQKSSQTKFLKQNIAALEQNIKLLNEQLQQIQKRKQDLIKLNSFLQKKNQEKDVLIHLFEQKQIQYKQKYQHQIHQWQKKIQQINDRLQEKQKQKTEFIKKQQMQKQQLIKFKINKQELEFIIEENNLKIKQQQLQSHLYNKNKQQIKINTIRFEEQKQQFNKTLIQIQQQSIKNKQFIIICQQKIIQLQTQNDKIQKQSFQFQNQLKKKIQQNQEYKQINNQLKSQVIQLKQQLNKLIVNHSEQINRINSKINSKSYKTLKSFEGTIQQQIQTDKIEHKKTNHFLQISSLKSITSKAIQSRPSQECFEIFQKQFQGEQINDQAATPQIQKQYLQKLKEQLRLLCQKQIQQFSRSFQELHSSSAIDVLYSLRQFSTTTQQNVLSELAFIDHYAVDFFEDISPEIHQFLQRNNDKAEINVEMKKRIQELQLIVKEKNILLQSFERQVQQLEQEIQVMIQEKEEEEELKERQYMNQAQIYKKQISAEKNRADGSISILQSMRKNVQKILQIWFDKNNTIDDLVDCFEQLQNLCPRLRQKLKQYLQLFQKTKQGEGKKKKWFGL